MARVFDRPRYSHQSRNRLVALAVATEDLSIVKDTGAILGLNNRDMEIITTDWPYLADLALGGTDVDEIMPELDQNLESYLLDAEIGRLSRGSLLSHSPAASRVMRSFIATATERAPTKVLWDEHALFYLISTALDADPIIRESDDSISARRAAQDLIFYQLLPQKIASGAWKQVADRARLTQGIGPHAAKFDAWIQAAENLEYRAHPMWVKYCRIWAMDHTRLRPHVAKMVDKVAEAPDIERFKSTGLGVAFPTATVYNYNGILCVYLGTTLLILDNSAASYLRTVMTSLRNCYISFDNYRLTGDPNADAERPAILATFASAMSWIREHVRQVGNARYLARHMHLAYTRWQNAVGEGSAAIDAGWKTRDKDLAADMMAVWPRTDRWYDLVTTAKIADRHKAEILKLYHLLPPADIDPLLLHKEIIAKTSSTNPVKPAAISAFIDFCKAYDLVRFLKKNRKDPAIKEEVGYTCRDKEWYTRSKAGRFTMPPKAEWGKAQIHREFPFDHSGDFHTLNAKDATRVMAARWRYMDRDSSRATQPVDNNELLAAIFRGPELSNGETMEAWRERVFTRNLRDDDQIIAAEAGKAENTKPGAKVRETLSACDTAREILTEVDQSLRPLAAQTPGVSIRIDQVRHKRKFQAMAQAVSKGATRHALATSTDIKGWSPYMPRQMFHAWQDYALSTTECPDPTAVRQIWDRLQVFVDRRGVKAIAPVRDGNIQGWPATSDTTMHAHILIYWAHMLKEEKILSPSEAAYTLCLIDDAATVVAIQGNAKEAAEKADRAREKLKQVYADLGFVMDDVKSFFSSIKFVYLNELYLDGAQVAHATKTMMRIDRDHTRRFASLPEQISTAFGTAASAAAQGADPFVAYWMAAWVAFRLAYRVFPRLAELPHFHQMLIALAPAGMNGLGIRPITAVFATGATDILTWYLEITSGIAPFGGKHEISAIITQEPAVASTISAFKNPFGYTVESHISAADTVRRAFRDTARARGLAQPFCDLDKIERDAGYEAAVKAMLDAGAYEASLLEEVASSMPDSFVDEVLSRVDKNELIAFLLGSRGIGALRRRVRNADVNNLSVIVDLVQHAANADPTVTDQLIADGSFETAKAMRNRYLKDFTILNHTYPCPYSMWAFAGEVDLESAAATRRTTVSFDVKRLLTTTGSSGKNLYDSAMHHIGYKGYKSAASNLKSEARVSLYNPVRKKVAAGLAALRWARDNGAHHHALTALFLHAWAGHTDDRVLDLPGKQHEGSAKRMSARHSKTNHLVMCYNNTQASVKVDARAITAYQVGSHHMYDMMGAITTLRCAGLLEASLQIGRGTDRFAYGFLYKLSGDAAMAVPDSPEVVVPEASVTSFQPFVNIKSSMASSARVCLSITSMQDVLQTYTNLGTRAANKAFKDMVNAGELDAAAEEGMDLELKRVRVSLRATQYSRVAETTQFILGDIGKNWTREDIVPLERSTTRVTEPLAVTTAALDNAARFAAIGRSMNDTLAITLANRHPAIATAIVRAKENNDLESFVDSESWEDARPLVTFDWDMCGKFLSAVRAARGEVSLQAAVHEVLRCAGMPGFRARLTKEWVDEDAQHAIMSFVMMADSVFGRLRALATSLRGMKRDYTSVDVVGATNPTKATASIITGRWRMAAARYSSRADSLAADPANSTYITKLNYQSVFLKAAARSLTSDGKMASGRLNLALVDAARASLIKHMPNEDEEAKFEMRLEAESLSAGDIDSVRDRDDVRNILTGIMTEAADFGARIDTDAVFEALTQVYSWVDQDCGGTHTATKLISKYRRTEEFVTQVAPEPEPPAPPAPVMSEMDKALAAVFASGGTIMEEAPATIDTTIPPAEIFSWAEENHWAQIMDFYAPLRMNYRDYYAHITQTREAFQEWYAKLTEIVSAEDIGWPENTVVENPDWADVNDDGEWVQ